MSTTISALLTESPTLDLMFLRSGERASLGRRRIRRAVKAAGVGRPWMRLSMPAGLVKVRRRRLAVAGLRLCGGGGAFAVVGACAADLFVLAAVGAVLRAGGGEHAAVLVLDLLFFPVQFVLQTVEKRKRLVVLVEARAEVVDVLLVLVYVQSRAVVGF